MKTGLLALTKCADFDQPAHKHRLIGVCAFRKQNCWAVLNSLNSGSRSDSANLIWNCPDGICSLEDCSYGVSDVRFSCV